ncbi:copper-binding transcription factor, partial [Linderina pennispora]
MILIEGKKYACQACIRGHRASSCNHTSRELIEIRPKGRPVSQCERCRLMRKTHKAHVKCECMDKDTKPAVAKRKSRKLNIEELPRSRISSIENLLNPCACTEEKFCACCRPMFSAYLNKNYPAQIVEETAKSFSANLMAPQGLTQTLDSEDDGLPACPSGPEAPCCKIRPLAAHREHEKQMARTKDQLQFASTPAPNSIDTHGGQDIRPLSRPPATTSVPNGDSAQRMLEVSSGPSVPTQNGEKPDCKCGCDCGKKLELLIHAIEARIGQPLASSSELNIHADDDPSEWVENVLGPLSPAIRLTATTTSSGGSSTSLSLSSSSVADVPEVDDSGFSAGVIPPLPTTAISSSCCTVKVDPTPRAPSVPKSSC